MSNTTILINAPLYFTVSALVNECVFTSVCTMAGLCVRSILTVWKMSTAPS